jgi:ribosome-binding factor A
MAGSRRTQRVQREMLRVLGRVLLREIGDERLHKTMVTLTRTKVSADFSYLDAWISCPGEEKHQRAMLSLVERAKPFLRKRLGEEVQLRVVPELRFHLDQTLDHAARIEGLLDQVQEEREARARAITESELDGEEV